MAYSIVYGNAFPDERDDNARMIRQYHRAGKTWTGFDTDDIGHYCSRSCAMDAVRQWTPTDGGDAWLRGELDGAGDVQTADMGGFDPGDDPYVVCDTCGDEIYRDDEAYEAMYGTPINGTTTTTITTNNN